MGPIKDGVQLNIALEKNYYHVPKASVNLVRNKINYVALAKPKKEFGEEAGISYFGKVIEIEEVKRRDITDLPKDSDDIYYLIKVEGWQVLKKKIEVGGFALIRPIYSSKYLLDNVEKISELLIKDRDEFRD